MPGSERATIIILGEGYKAYRSKLKLRPNTLENCEKALEGGDYKFRLIRYSNIRVPFAILTRRIHVIIWWPTVELQIEIKDSGGKPPSFPREKVIEIFSEYFEAASIFITKYF